METAGAWRASAIDYVNGEKEGTDGGAHVNCTRRTRSHRRFVVVWRRHSACGTGDHVEVA